MAEISLRDYLAELDSLLASGAADEVIYHSRHILQYYPKNVAAYRDLGRALILNGRWDEAEAALRRVLAVVPDDYHAHYGLSEIYDNKRRGDEAIWHLERALEADGSPRDLTDPMRQLYKRYRGSDQVRIPLTAGAVARQAMVNRTYERAIETLRGALSRHKDRTDLRLLLAQCLWEGGDPVEAAEESVSVLEVLPDCLVANSIMTRLWLQEERPSDAQRYLTHVEAVDPYLAVELATGEVVAADTFRVQKLDVKRSAQAEISTARPDWLQDIDAPAPGAAAAEDWSGWSGGDDTAVVGMAAAAAAAAALPSEPAPTFSADSFDVDAGSLAAEPESDLPDWMSTPTQQMPVASAPAWLQSESPAEPEPDDALFSYEAALAADASVPAPQVEAQPEAWLDAFPDARLEEQAAGEQPDWLEHAAVLDEAFGLETLNTGELPADEAIDDTPEWLQNAPSAAPPVADDDATLSVSRGAVTSILGAGGYDLDEPDEAPEVAAPADDDAWLSEVSSEQQSVPGPKRGLTAMLGEAEFDWMQSEQPASPADDWARQFDPEVPAPVPAEGELDWLNALQDEPDAPAGPSAAVSEQPAPPAETPHEEPSVTWEAPAVAAGAVAAAAVLSSDSDPFDWNSVEPTLEEADAAVFEQAEGHPDAISMPEADVATIIDLPTAGVVASDDDADVVLDWQAADEPLDEAASAPDEAEFPPIEELLTLEAVTLGPDGEPLEVTEAEIAVTPDEVVVETADLAWLDAIETDEGALAEPAIPVEAAGDDLSWLDAMAAAEQSADAAAEPDAPWLSDAPEGAGVLASAAVDEAEVDSPFDAQPADEAELDAIEADEDWLAAEELDALNEASASMAVGAVVGDASLAEGATDDDTFNWLDEVDPNAAPLPSVAPTVLAFEAARFQEDGTPIEVMSGEVTLPNAAAADAALTEPVTSEPDADEGFDWLDEVDTSDTAGSLTYDAVRFDETGAPVELVSAALIVDQPESGEDDSLGWLEAADADTQDELDAAAVALTIEEDPELEAEVAADPELAALFAEGDAIADELAAEDQTATVLDLQAVQLTPDGTPMTAYEADITVTPDAVAIDDALWDVDVLDAGADAGDEDARLAEAVAAGAVVMTTESDDAEAAVNWWDSPEAQEAAGEAPADGYDDGGNLPADDGAGFDLPTAETDWFHDPLAHNDRPVASEPLPVEPDWFTDEAILSYQPEALEPEPDDRERDAVWAGVGAAAGVAALHATHVDQDEPDEAVAVDEALAEESLAEAEAESPFDDEGVDDDLLYGEEEEQPAIAEAAAVGLAAAALSDADQDEEPEAVVEPLEEAPANVPDWLNAMVPGLDVDYEAEEDAPLETGFLEPTAPDVIGHAPVDHSDFGWVDDIVALESSARPVDFTPLGEAIGPYHFSVAPAWLAAQAEASPNGDENSVDLPEWLR